MIAVFNLLKVTDGAILVTREGSTHQAWIPKKLVTDVDGVLGEITPTTPLDPVEPIELELPDWLAAQKGLL